MTSARTKRENICDECGLPISICNAKAMFELAVRRNGREAVIAAILDAKTEQTEQPAPDAVARLVKLADQLDQNATNAERMVALLQPEFDAFLARSGSNVYVVRDYVDHQNAAKRQRQEAFDIRAAIAAMESAQ